MLHSIQSLCITVVQLKRNAYRMLSFLNYLGRQAPQIYTMLGLLYVM